MRNGNYPRESICRRCGCDHMRSETEMRTGKSYCLPCQAAISREWFKKQRKRGLPYKSITREAKRAYSAEYRKRPEVMARRRAQNERRLADPIEQIKERGRSKTRQAIAAGKLLRQPCEVCGESKVDAHHDDYSKPLEVRWLCRLHHRQHHLSLTEKPTEPETMKIVRLQRGYRIVLSDGEFEALEQIVALGTADLEGSVKLSPVGERALRKRFSLIDAMRIDEDRRKPKKGRYYTSHTQGRGTAHPVASPKGGAR